jgi:uncharacterized protein (TIGR03435 family)
MMKRAPAGLIPGILLAHLAFAQASATRQAFEAADVRVSAPGTRDEGGFLPEGRSERRGATMLDLIGTAYNMNTDLILGGPDWVASDRFDIVAKAPSRQAAPGALREMLQLLLADRFGLAVHNEQRNMPVYLLTVGRKGAKLGRAANSGAPECPSVDGDPGLNHRSCHAFAMADLSRLLPRIARNYVDRPVIDTTGLEGAYDFPLDWMGKAAYLAAKSKGAQAVSMFDAIGKLGLTLEPGTHPAPVLVIDHVNRTPAEDPVSAKSAATPVEFDVAEIRPSKSPERQGLSALPSGQVEILGYTLRELISLAFEVKDDRVMGGPKWLDSDRFDVIAKSPEALSPHAISAMLKTLIVERFKLATHTEKQPVTVFALVGERHGPKLQQTSGARSECRLSLAEKGRAFDCRNTTMGQLVERLPDVAQAYLTHPLVDLTGLAGAYDFTLTWTPKAQLPRPVPGQPGDGMVQASTPDGDLTVFEAIAKQLGLSIEERKYPMPVVVVDYAEQITAANL